MFCLEQFKILLDCVLEDFFDASEDVVHVQHVLRAGQVDEDLPFGSVLIFELLTQEFRRHLVKIF